MFLLYLWPSHPSKNAITKLTSAGEREEKREEGGRRGRGKREEGGGRRGDGMPI